MYSDLYTYECKEMALIKEYIQRDGAHRTPLVVAGEPGSGKTVLLAASAKKVHSWLKDSDPKLVVRFSSPSGDSSSLSNFLTGLCQQIAENYQKQVQTHLKDVKELRNCFVDLLSASSKQCPLVLILDVLDQISEDDSVKNLWWLPGSFPPFVKVIISTTPRKFDILEILKNLYKDPTVLLDLKPQRKVCNENLKQSLLAVHRKITSGQQLYVNRSLESNTSHLLALLLSKEVIHWRAHDNVNDETLGKSQHESIERLFHRLEMKYGSPLVSRALSYITLARSGIGETELVDILSTDDTVMARFFTSSQVVDIWRVPESMVASMVLDLNGCLSQRLFMGSMLLCWTHMCYQFLVYKLYLNNATVVHELHTIMGHYFSGRWSYGRAKPYSMKQTSYQLISTQSKCDPSTESKNSSKIYVDRQQPSQPWLFGLQFDSQSSFLTNIRKAHELPFHLKKCGRLDDICNIMLTVFPFYKAMIKADQLNLLLSEVEDTSRLTGKKELKFISDILREASCLLHQNPATLEMVFQAKMIPLTTEYPSLLNLMKQVYHEGLKSSVIVPLHSPLATIEPKRVHFVEPSTIICILEMQVESLIIVVFANAAVYTWNVGKRLTLVYPSSFDIVARDAELSQDGRRLILATESNSILIVDCITWSLICEMNGSRFLTMPLDFPLVLKGFHVLDTHLYVWFENSSFVRVFDITSGESLSDLVCHQSVNCCSSTKNGKYVLLGQENIVSIFETDNFSYQTTIPSESHGHCVRAAYISESDTEVYIVDTVGNITVWGILDPKQPQCLDEVYSSEESGEIISAEHAVEFKWLLLCKLNHIQVWNTDSWGMEEFRAPKNSSFACAVFSGNCEHIIAAVQMGSSLLVWRRDCGQCVLKLDVEFGEVEKLNKCVNQSCLVAVMTGGFLAAWNLDLIGNAASMYKAKQPIKSVLLSPFGDHFYTSDGSEDVWKWNSSSYKVEAILNHDDSIENTKLTATGEFLVTSVTQGDLYVWCTDTGESLLRIHGSHASQVLLTPNSHFVVSLCENSMSRVWKLTTGHLVCTFHTYLRRASITPESTFIIGLHKGDLIAFSLWSGCVSKRFQCSDESNILAFQTLLSHPDITVVVTLSRNVYTWNVAEETICHQIQLPIHFPCQVSDCQMSSDGSIVITMAEKCIHVLNTHSGKLGVLSTEGTVLFQHLSKDGRFIVFVCFTSENIRECDFHANPVLNVAQVSNGEIVGQYFLGKMPSSLTVSEDDLTICIGYDDGTVGVYTIVEMDEDKKKIQTQLSLKSKDAQTPVNIKMWLSKETPDILWLDSQNVFTQQ